MWTASRSILQILAFNSHYDKRPLNALSPRPWKSVSKKGSKYFVYGNYVYGNKKDSSLVEFKRRNGFEQLNFPRYYIPAHVEGKNLRRACGCIAAWWDLLPAPVLNLLLKIRDQIYARKEKAGRRQTGNRDRRE